MKNVKRRFEFKHRKTLKLELSDITKLEKY
jgi:hypothetical protein